MAAALLRVCDAAQAKADTSPAEVDLGVPDAGAESDQAGEEQARPATGSNPQAGPEDEDEDDDEEPNLRYDFPTVPGQGWPQMLTV